MDTLKSSCLHELDGKVNNDIDLLVRKIVDISIALNRIIVIAALVIAVAIILSAFISRSKNGVAQWRSVGTNRIFNTQTGEVKWAVPPEGKK